MTCICTPRLVCVRANTKLQGAKQKCIFRSQYFLEEGSIFLLDENVCNSCFQFFSSKLSPQRTDVYVINFNLYSASIPMNFILQ